MDHIGWSQDGVFTKLLRSADYNFCQGAERPRLVAQTYYWRVAPALAILLFEQYVFCSLSLVLDNIFHIADYLSTS